MCSSRGLRATATPELYTLSLHDALPISNVKCALEHKDAWQLLVATILSAQCTDKRVNIVTPELFRKYPTIQDMAARSEEHTSELQSLAYLVCRLLLEKTKNYMTSHRSSA